MCLVVTTLNRKDNLKGQLGPQEQGQISKNVKKPEALFESSGKLT